MSAVNGKAPRKTSATKKKSSGSAPNNGLLPPGVTTPGVTNLVACPLCKKPYHNPKLLRCLHSFCEPCLKTSLEGMRLGPDQKFRCPICRTECLLPKRGTSSLPENVLLETIGELTAKKTVPQIPKCQGCEENPPAEAKMKCVECDDWLCATCVDMHRRVSLVFVAMIFHKEWSSYIQSSAIITWSSLLRHYIRHYHNSGEKWIRI